LRTLVLLSSKTLETFLNSIIGFFNSSKFLLLRKLTDWDLVRMLDTSVGNKLT